MSKRTHTDSQASTAIDLFAEEEHMSEHSEPDKRDIHNHFKSYYSTALIVDKNLTLADVVVEPLTQSRLRDMQTLLTAKCKDKRCFFGITDPRGELNARKREGDVATLVPYAQV